MSHYFFILGRNPELSLAELNAVLPPDWKSISYCKEVLLVECSKLNAETLMRRLGGTIKMGEILSHNPCPVSHNTIIASLGKTSPDKKLFLGLSAYALEEKVRLPNIHILRQLGIEVKRELQEQGYKVRLVTSKEIALSSVIVKKERLLRQGAELVLFYRSAGARPPQAAHEVPRYNSEEIFIGRTLAVQEFEEQSARDYGRPERSMGVGMLPIQLTKIMLNLARAPKDATILDPFCGLGTVLMEATQMGYTHLIGTDLEQKMVEATRENLGWLTTPHVISSEAQAKPRDLLRIQDTQLIATPVEQLSKHLSPNSVDAIVTEPYMGPTRDPAQPNILLSELSTLYISAFREFSKILKPDGRVVFIFPAFKSGTALTKTSDRVLPEIKKLGFTPTPLLPSELINISTYKLTNSLLYSRPDQRVLREIFMFEYKK